MIWFMILLHFTDQRKQFVESIQGEMSYGKQDIHIILILYYFFSNHNVVVYLLNAYSLSKPVTAPEWLWELKLLVWCDFSVYYWYVIHLSFFFLRCMYVVYIGAFAYMCVCMRVLDLLELELQIVMRFHVHVVNWTWVLWYSSQRSWWLSHLSNPCSTFWMLSFILGIFDVQHLDFSSLGPPQSFCGKPKYYWCSDVFFLAFPLTEYLFQTSQPQSHNGYRIDWLVTFIQYPSGSTILVHSSTAPFPVSISTVDLSGTRDWISCVFL